MKKTLPVRVQFVVIAFLVITVVLVSFIVYYSRVSQLVIDRNEQYTSDIFNQVQYQVTSNCELLQKLLFNVAYDQNVQNFLIEDDPLARYELSVAVQTSLNRNVTFNTGILDIAILGENGNSVSVSGGALFLKTGGIVFPARGKTYFTEVMTYTSGVLDYPVILVGTNAYSIELGRSFGNNLGKVAVIADVRTIGWMGKTGRDTSDTAFYLIDRAGKIFYAEDSAQIGTPFDAVENLFAYERSPSTITIDGERYIVRVDRLDLVQGAIVGLTPLGDLLSDLMIIRTSMLLILAVVLLFLILLLMMISRNILRPITRITAFINTLKSGDVRTFDDRLHIEGYAEIVGMAEEFNSLLDQIGELTGRLIEANSRLYRTELLKKHTELAMLQSQINPHFLYNTLESVKGMALAAGAENVAAMTKALGRVFRYAVKGTDIVLFSEELDILKSYILIQQIRFRDRFTSEYRIHPETLDCRIPKMILQPIVENAVIHGIELKPKGGVITVSAEITEDDVLRIQVRDNGAGIAAERLNKLVQVLDRTRTEEDLDGESNHPVGLRNVQGRIRILYGERYGIRIESGRDEGTLVTYRLPARAGAVYHV